MRKEYNRELEKSIHVLASYDLRDFLTPKSTPVLSIYIPIHRTERENRRDVWDRIELKDLVKEGQRRLLDMYDERQVKPLIEKLDYLVKTEDLPAWLNASAGLGFLVNAEEAYVIDLSYAPKPCVVAGEHYYVKPLIHNMEYQMDYRLLLLNADFFALLDGDFNEVRFVPMPDDVKEYFAETYAEFDGETTALDYYSLEDHHSPYEAFKSRNDVKQEEAEKFFRYVNKVMNDELVRDSEVPVFLVTLPEHESEFRKIATFKSLAPEAILKDARTMTGDELRDAAVKIMQARRAKAIDELKEKYGYHASKGTASEDPVQIGQALFERKVGKLLLECGKGIPGGFNADTGAVAFDDTPDPLDEHILDPASPDICNAFAAAALRQDADIIVLDASEMPTKSGVAAIYRF